jgi:hypothetical protein
MRTETERENFEYCKRIAEELEQYINGEIVDDETGEELTLYDYFNDVLDMEFIINSDLSYRAVKVYVTLGGPTVWIDTYTCCIELRWANESARYGLSSDTINAIDEVWEEYYDSIR